MEQVGILKSIMDKLDEITKIKKGKNKKDG